MSTNANRIDFTPQDEAKMASAASWGQIVAISCIAIAAIALPVQLAQSPWSGLLAFGIRLALGASLLVACRSFRRVARTDDDDSGELLAGFRHLRRYFVIQGLIILLSLVLAVAAAMNFFGSLF